MQVIAVDENGKPVHVAFAEPHKRYYCCICRAVSHRVNTAKSSFYRLNAGQKHTSKECFNKDTGKTYDLSETNIITLINHLMTPVPKPKKRGERGEGIPFRYVTDRHTPDPWKKLPYSSLRAMIRDYLARYEDVALPNGLKLTDYLIAFGASHAWADDDLNERIIETYPAFYSDRKKAIYFVTIDSKTKLRMLLELLFLDTDDYLLYRHKVFSRNTWKEDRYLVAGIWKKKSMEECKEVCRRTCQSAWVCKGMQSSAYSSTRQLARFSCEDNATPPNENPLSALWN